MKTERSGDPALASPQITLSLPAVSTLLSPPPPSSPLPPLLSPPLLLHPPLSSYTLLSPPTPLLSPFTHSSLQLFARNPYFFLVLHMLSLSRSLALSLSLSLSRSRSLSHSLILLVSLLDKHNLNSQL
ncbi:unnamed protein product [Arctogadus glacialis]